MKKTIIIALSLLLLVGSAFGQSKFVPHKKGDAAMLFSFSGLANLGANSYGGGFGYKKFMNDKMAIRGLIDLYNYSGTISWNPEFWGEGYVGDDGKSTEFEVDLGVAAEIHRNTGKVDPYYGGGVGFTINRTKYVDPAVGIQGTALAAKETKNDLDGDARTVFSAFGLLGLEYTVNSLITLAAEYRLGFNFVGQPDMKETEPSGTETSYSGSKYTFISLGAQALTLAVYLNR